MLHCGSVAGDQLLDADTGQPGSVGEREHRAYRRVAGLAEVGRPVDLAADDAAAVEGAAGQQQFELVGRSTGDAQRVQSARSPVQPVDQADTPDIFGNLKASSELATFSSYSIQLMCQQLRDSQVPPQFRVPTPVHAQAPLG